MGRRHLADPALATHDPLTHEPAARAPDRIGRDVPGGPGLRGLRPGGAKHTSPPRWGTTLTSRFQNAERLAGGRRGRVPGGDRAQARALGQGDGVRDLRRLGDAGWVAERGGGGAAAVARDHRVVAAVRRRPARPRAARRATAPPPLGRLRGHQAPRRGLPGAYAAGVGGRREPRGGRAGRRAPVPAAASACASARTALPWRRSSPRTPSTTLETLRSRHSRMPRGSPARAYAPRASPGSTRSRARRRRRRGRRGTSATALCRLFLRATLGARSARRTVTRFYACVPRDRRARTRRRTIS